MKKKKLSESILEEIRRMIVSGELKVGDKLPNQNEFAAQLGVSRPSLREALQALTNLGAIEQKPGAGTKLIARPAALLTEKMDLPLISDAQATLELVESRRMVEVGMVRLAAARISDKELSEIGEALGKMEEALEGNRPADYYENDFVFHQLIALAAHNRFVTAVFQNLRQVFEQFLLEAFSIMPNMLERSLADHKKIFRSLESRDPDKAARAMADHIINVEEAMERYYESRNPM